MPNTLLKAIFLLLLFALASAVNAQPHKRVELKMNSTFNSETISGVAQIVIDYPQHGSYSFDNVSGGFIFSYTPDSAYIGRDSVIIEYMSTSGGDIEYEVFFFNVKPSLIYLEDDYYPSEKDQGYTNYFVLSNDSGTDMPFSLNEILHTANGFAYIDNDSLFFKPKANFEGVSTVTYKACDSLGYCDNAQAKFIVVDPDNIATEDTLVLYTPKNTPTRFILPDTAFEVQLSPDLGVIEDEIEGRVFEYSPFQNSSGTDVALLSNSELDRTVIIHVIDVPTPNQRVVDDYVYTHVDNTVEFNVLSNDFISSGRVSSFTSAPNGSLTKLSGGNFRFIPDSDFEGLTQFTYTTCLFGANCETGRVKIFVGNLNPDNRSNYSLITPKNRDLVINYEVPIANFMFDVDQDCSYGDLSIYPGLDTLQIGCEEVSGYNMVVYSPDSNYVGEDEFDLEYCVNGGSDCQIVKVKVDVIDKNLDSVCICADDCVWPGDINHDGKVDMLDLLSLGWNIGLDGEERPFAQPSEWYGQYAPNWDEQQNNKSNLKHADVDGDGIVSISDKSAIDTFYSNIHSILNDPIKEPRLYPIMLELEGPQDPEPGDYVLMNVLAGTETNPAYDLHGINLNLDFHPDIVDTSTIELFFSSSSWLASNDASIELVKHEGRSINGAISRIDRRGRAGFGLVAQVGFIVEDDLDGIRSESNIISYNVGFSKASVMLGDGSTIDVKTNPVPLQIQMYNSQEEDRLSESDVFAFPNPVSDVLHVRSNKNEIRSIEILNMQGQRVYIDRFSETSPAAKIKTSHLGQGLYILRVEGSRGKWVSKKIVVVD